MIGQNDLISTSTPREDKRPDRAKTAIPEATGTGDGSIPATDPQQADASPESGAFAQLVKDIDEASKQTAEAEPSAAPSKPQTPSFTLAAAESAGADLTKPQPALTLGVADKAVQATSLLTDANPEALEQLIGKAAPAASAEVKAPVQQVGPVATPDEKQAPTPIPPAISPAALPAAVKLDSQPSEGPKQAISVSAPVALTALPALATTKISNPEAKTTIPATTLSNSLEGGKADTATKALSAEIIQAPERLGLRASGVEQAAAPVLASKTSAGAYNSAAAVSSATSFALKAGGPEALEVLKPGGDTHLISATISRTEAANSFQQPAPAALSTNLNMAKAVATQIGAAASRMDGAKIEIRLEPPELGRVSLSFVVSDDGMTAVLAADRSETIELMRRHADQLQKELSAAGYEGVDIAFSDQQETASEDDAETGSSFAEAETDGKPDALTPEGAKTGLSGLDIRI